MFEKSGEVIQLQWRKTKKKKKKENFENCSKTWGIFKSAVRGPKGYNRENGQEAIFEEILTENFLELMKDTKYNTKEAQPTQGEINIF